MSREKIIKCFEYLHYGIFIDLEDMEASVSVNTQTGDVLLDEGSEDNCYAGCVVRPKETTRFELCGDDVVLHSGTISHSVGRTSDHKEATEWIKKANEIINKVNKANNKEYPKCQCLPE